MKSGTNRLQGTAYTFIRNGALDARNYFAPGNEPDPEYRRAQSGFSLGGPIIQNKLFFFGGYQGTIRRQVPTSNIAYVPTAQMLAGDFTTLASPACNAGRQITLGAPFVNNRIDPALYHPIALKMMNMLPTPDPSIDPDGCGRYVLQIPNDSDEQQYIGRMDYQMTPSKRLFGRAFYTKYLHAPGFDKANPNLLMLSGAGLGIDARMMTFASGYDWVVSPALVATTRVTYQ